MAFEKGKSGNPNGKPKGTKSKLTASAKEAFQIAFEKLGGAEALSKWAKSNQTDFYKLFARLIPTDVTSDGKPVFQAVEVIIHGKRDAEN